jgi:Short C-terminal domain
MILNLKTPELKNPLESIEYFHKAISVLIKQNEKETTTNNQTNVNSIADEIKKLSDLHKEGLLTEEEFNSQKHRLLTS